MGLCSSAGKLETQVRRPDGQNVMVGKKTHTCDGINVIQLTLEPLPLSLQFSFCSNKHLMMELKYTRINNILVRELSALYDMYISRIGQITPDNVLEKAD